MMKVVGIMKYAYTREIWSRRRNAVAPKISPQYKKQASTAAMHGIIKIPEAVEK